ncbi:hypothetical protein ACG7TL_008371 [Trametes sanguinea]
MYRLDPLVHESPLLSPPNSLHSALAPPAFPHLRHSLTMSTSTTAKSASTKGKKAATPAQLRAAAREELNALFASAPGGSIAGEEEYEDFARRVLAQLDVIGGGEYTEEVAYQASRLVRETVGFATGVEGAEVDAEVPWTHPIYRQAFAQVQAEIAAERADREGEDEAPASVVEVEAEVTEVDELAGDDMEVVEEAPPVPQTRAKGKVAPRPIRVPEYKPAAKVIVSKPKRALPADEPSATPSPRKKARAEALAFPSPVWRPASAEPSLSIRCSYCAAHPKGGRCVLREGFTKCDRCLLSRQGCWAPGGGRKLFGEWYDAQGHLRAVRLDGVIAAKVIRSRGRASDMPAWVKEAWDQHKSVRQALHAAGEGSLGESSASEITPPRSGRAVKASAPPKTARTSLPSSASSAKLSHVEVPVPRVRIPAPVASSSSQPVASSSQAAPPPPSPSPAPATPPTGSLPPPAAQRHASPNSPPRQPSVPPFAAEEPLAPPAFRTPASAAASAMPPPPPPTPQQLGLGGLVERETQWFRETFARHLVANFSRPQDSAPIDPHRTPAGDAYVRALESVRDALSGQVAALAATRDELRLRARNAPLSDAEIFGHYANR